MILDEPTSSLDSHTAGQLLAFMRRAVAGGISCIFISHLLGEVLQNSDRIVVMRDGRTIASDRAEAFDRDRLVATMGGTEAPRTEANANDCLPEGKLRCVFAPAHDNRADPRNWSPTRARSSALPGSPATARPSCRWRFSRPR